MSIVRTIHNRENPYVQINKEGLWDKNLSLDAVGLWARLLSRPDNWNIKASELAKSCGCSIKKIYRILNELIENGYAYRHQPKKTEGKNLGHFSSYDTYVFEFKISEEEIQKILPLGTFPLSGEPLSGNGHTTNIDLIPKSTSSTKIEREERESKKKSSAPPPSADAESLTDFFLKSIKERNPNFKEPNAKTWMEEMDLLLRKDKRDPVEVFKVIDWAAHSTFWQANCLCPKSLRKSYDKIFMQMQGDEEKNRIKINMNISYQLKDQYPKEAKALSWDAKYVINRATGKEVPFHLPKEQFLKALVNLFGGDCV